ncbi:MAG TPA: cupin domain-containing protein [Solirubrobacterales bacterium]|nr:cupin domain-containing protein [Solirubrobacterales bacterium]
MPSPFTHKRLTDVKDSGLEFGFEGIQEARFAKRDLEAEDTGVTHLRLLPGQRSPFGHRHEKAEEVYVVISGSGRMKLDEEIVELAALDAVRVSPPVTRAFEAGPEGLELIVVGPRHDGDGELVRDWWVD